MKLPPQSTAWLKSWLGDGGLSLGRHPHTNELYPLSEAQQAGHTLITGQSGTGKTMMIAALALQLILRGSSLILIDLIGTLSRYLKQALAANLLQALVHARRLPPAERRYHLARVERGYERLQLLMFAEPCAAQARFAPFERVEGLSTPELAAGFSAGMERVLEGDLATMRALGLNLTALSCVLIDAGGATPHDLVKLCCMDARDLRSYLKRVEGLRRRGVLRMEYRPDLLRQYMSRLFAETSQQRRADLVMSTIRGLNLVLSDPVAGQWLSSPRSNLNLPQLMRTGGVLIISLPPLNLHTQRAMGGFLLGQISGLALRRDSQAVITGALPPVHLMIDEFQRLFTPEMAQNIAVYRNQGLLLMLAHQSSRQDPFHTPEGQSLLGSVADNSLNKFTLRVGPTDAKRLAQEYFFPQGCKIKRDELQPFLSVRHRWQRQATSLRQQLHQQQMAKRESKSDQHSQERSHQHLRSHTARSLASRRRTSTHSDERRQGQLAQTQHAHRAEQQVQAVEEERQRQSQRQHWQTQQQQRREQGSSDQSQSQHSSSQESFTTALSRHRHETGHSDLHRREHAQSHQDLSEREQLRRGAARRSTSHHRQDDRRRQTQATQTQAQAQEREQLQQRERSVTQEHAARQAHRRVRQREHQREQLDRSSHLRSQQEDLLHEHLAETRQVREYYSVAEEQIVLAQQLQTLPNRSVMVLEQGSGAPRVNTLRTLDMPLTWTTTLGAIDGMKQLEKYCTPQTCEPEPELSLSDRLPAGLRRSPRNKGDK